MAKSLNPPRATSLGLTLICAGLATQLLAMGGPRPQPSPDVGMDGAASMHGDIASSDTTPLAGPGAGPLELQSRLYYSTCPTVLVREDGNPMVLCTRFADRAPVVRLLDQNTGGQMAELALTAGSLLGGVYAFLDSSDRLVMVDGNQNLVRVAASFDDGAWSLSIDETIPLASAIADNCGAVGCDTVVSVSAGTAGSVWFATLNAGVGIADAYGNVSMLQLAPGERVDNSFSTTASGEAVVVTNRALYVLHQDGDVPVLDWREGYDAGSARKPGNLSNGSGATPSIFGPETGEEYVTITDNADAGISLIVRSMDDGSLVCQLPIFDADASGTENSAIAIGNSVVVASTYGYPYPSVPAGAGPAVPATADFVGGMVHVDVKHCTVRWENEIRSAAVPKYSTADDLIYTVERKSVDGTNGTNDFVDSYLFTVISPGNGKVIRQTPIGAGYFANTLQMAGNAGLDSTYWQGNVGGIVRIAPE